MCSTCGCGSDEARVTTLDGTAGHHAHGGHDEHAHEHPHEHPHDDPRTHTLELEIAVLGRNDELAERNRHWLADRRVTALNLMSSPGAGKTTLLERTISASRRPVSVIEGDQETLFDAERIRRAGARAVQVNTGAGCHLDAAMVSRALSALQPEEGSLLFVENVGNLVCPALFDLGELRKVVVISVTEGDDKPLKYPHMFAAADLVLVNKTDLLPYVDFDVDRLAADARMLNPGLELLPVSAKSGAGLDAWDAWLAAL
ncbi:MAG: hydrogenase nickel incorporation protein HypB [Nocardioidaceae bacterium]|nr:hydrogenase nickel incorporation protein HypB [Nocardioidaceae bacterium]